MPDNRRQTIWIQIGNSCDMCAFADGATPAVHPTLYDIKDPAPSAPLAPLSLWVALGSRRRVSSIPRVATKMFRFVKIGPHDALAFPNRASLTGS